MNTTNVSQMSIRKSAGKALVLCLLAAVAAAFLLIETAQAQEDAGYDYVDLVLTYEYDTVYVAYSVRNNGTATATGVTVSFLLEDLEAFFRVNYPSVIDKRTEDNTNQRFIWEIGTIRPGETSDNLTFATQNHSGHTTAKRIGVITPRPPPIGLNRTYCWPITSEKDIHMLTELSAQLYTCASIGWRSCYP